MVTIRLAEFTGYSQGDFEQFLFMQEERHYGFVIEKLSKLKRSNRLKVAGEYCMAAYLGHQLTVLGGTIGYHAPEATSDDPFIFDIETEDLRSLSAIVHRFIQAYYYLDDEVFVEYDVAAANHLAAAYNDEELEVGCWDLLEEAIKLVESV